MSRTIADVLDAAADLIEPEGRWTQGAHALNVHNYEAVGRDDAYCFCLLGAISFVCGGNPQDELGWEEHGVLFKLLGRDLPGWNDAPHRTQAEVVAKLREAATLARAEVSHG